MDLHSSVYTALGRPKSKHPYPRLSSILGCSSLSFVMQCGKAWQSSKLDCPKGKKSARGIGDALVDSQNKYSEAASTLQRKRAWILASGLTLAQTLYPCWCLGTLGQALGWCDLCVDGRGLVWVWTLGVHCSADILTEALWATTRCSGEAKHTRIAILLQINGPSSPQSCLPTVASTRCFRRKNKNPAVG